MRRTLGRSRFGLATNSGLKRRSKDRATRASSQGGAGGCDPEADEAGIGEHVVHPIGHDLAALLILEVVDVDAPRLAFWTIISAAVLEVADEFLPCLSG
jgi:hypothetical protein